MAMTTPCDAPRHRYALIIRELRLRLHLYRAHWLWWRCSWGRRCNSVSRSPCAARAGLSLISSRDSLSKIAPTADSRPLRRAPYAGMRALARGCKHNAARRRSDTPSGGPDRER